MENQFAAPMAKLTNSELLEIVTGKRNDYQPAALTAAEKELASRNLSQEEISISKIQIDQTKQADLEKANMPLGTGWKVLTFILPGIIVIFFSGVLKADGYDRKAKELVQWTFYGFGFYVGLIVLFSILGKIF